DLTTLDPDLVALAAAVLGSCVPDDGVTRNAAHIWASHVAAARNYYRMVEQLDCFAKAKCGCAAIEHCVGLAYRAAPAGCSGRCNGEVFTGCGDEMEVTLDCSRLGLVCDPVANCVSE